LHKIYDFDLFFENFLNEIFMSLTTPPPSPSSIHHSNKPLSLDEIAEYNTRVLSDEISQMKAVVEVIYDQYGNSVFFKMIPGTTLSNLELKNLIALRLEMISDINKDSEINKARNGIRITTLNGSKLKDLNECEFTFLKTTTIIQVIFNREIFPKEHPSTLQSREMAFRKIGGINLMHELGLKPERLTDSQKLYKESFPVRELFS
jgi:hypothetical protein